MTCQHNDGCTADCPLYPGDHAMTDRDALRAAILWARRLRAALATHPAEGGTE